LEIQKPDLAYFCEDDGKRTAFIFVQVKDNSELLGLADPWYIAFNAYVGLRPIMTFVELANTEPTIKKIAEKLAGLQRKPLLPFLQRGMIFKILFD